MPALAPVVDKLEDVAEPVRQFYVQKDGKYHVDLAAAPVGYVPASELAAANGKVVEFRDKNVQLMQEVEPLRAIKQKVGDQNIDVLLGAKTELDALKAKGVAKPDDVSAVVTAALDTFKQQVFQPVVEELKSEKAARAAAAETAAKAVLRSAVSEVFGKAGGQPDALDFIVGKTNGLFVVDGATVKAAPNVFSADRPGDPLSLNEWMARQVKESPFAFKASNGSGAQNNGGGGGGNVDRPAGQIVIKNPTPQQLGQYSSDVAKGKVRFEYDS